MTITTEELKELREIYGTGAFPRAHGRILRILDEVERLRVVLAGIRDTCCDSACFVYGIASAAMEANDGHKGRAGGFREKVRPILEGYWPNGETQACAARLIACLDALEAADAVSGRQEMVTQEERVRMLGLVDPGELQVAVDRLIIALDDADKRAEKEKKKVEWLAGRIAGEEKCHKNGPCIKGNLEGEMWDEYFDDGSCGPVAIVKPDGAYLTTADCAVCWGDAAEMAVGGNHVAMQVISCAVKPRPSGRGYKALIA